MAGPRVRAPAGEHDDRRPQGAGGQDDLSGAHAEWALDVRRQAGRIEDQQPALDADRSTGLEDDTIDGSVDQEPGAVLRGDGKVAADAGLLGPRPAAERAAAAGVAAGRVPLVGRRLIAQGHGSHR